MAKRAATIVAAMALMVAGQAGLAGQEYAAAGSRLRITSGLDRAVVRLAVEGAAARLESLECQRVLTDFTDPAGRTLAENLAALDRQPSQFLGELWFIDASRDRGCMENRIAAYTTPGSRVIYVCASLFGAANSPLNGRHGATIIIHEMLHALGLGENGPHPSPGEITRGVLKRCGR